MRILCDVCERNPASMMCCADEAALCAECDTRIHAASKVANKHVRVPLLTVAESPNCDICQEKRAYFFCLEDRAFLCRDCDVSIHKANTLSCKHNRFLVTGTRVALDAIKEDSPTEPLTSELQSPQLPASPTSTLQGPCSPNESSGNLKAYKVPTGPICMPRNHSYSGKAEGVTELQKIQDTLQAPKLNLQVPPASQLIPMPSLGTGLQSPGLLRKSSISEFLTDAVPGWRVEELLNLSDIAEGFNMNDVTPTKADEMSLGDFDWTADLSFFEEQMFADVFHEVPQVPPTPTLAALPRSIRLTRPTKGKGLPKQEILLPTSFDDAFIVPDLGIPRALVSPPCAKRRRKFHNL